MRKFGKIYIEITDTCNLLCAFCPGSRVHSPPQFISPEEFEQILLKIKGAADFLCFHVKGEPLLHPQLDTLLDIAHTHGCKIKLVTNGTLLDRYGTLLLKSPAVSQVGISLHSAVSNRGSITIDNYLDTIFSFINAAKGSVRPKIMLRLWNVEEADVVEQNNYVLECIEKEFHLDYTLLQHCTPFKSPEIANNVYLNMSRPFVWPDIEAPETGATGFCYGLRDQIAILVDGTVVPCCLDSSGVIALGNIYKQEFDEITGNVRARALFEGFSQRKVVEPLCRRCGYRTRFD
jgi:radical SAM protein with 4Fe4S-binding SPASM domain